MKIPLSIFCLLFFTLTFEVNAEEINLACKGIKSVNYMKKNFTSENQYDGEHLIRINTDSSSWELVTPNKLFDTSEEIVITEDYYRSKNWETIMFPYQLSSDSQKIIYRKTGILEEDINLKSVNDGSSVMSYTQIYQCKKVSNLF